MAAANFLKLHHKQCMVTRAIIKRFITSTGKVNSTQLHLVQIEAFAIAWQLLLVLLLILLTILHTRKSIFLSRWICYWLLYHSTYPVLRKVIWWKCWGCREVRDWWVSGGVVTHKNVHRVIIGVFVHAVEASSYFLKERQNHQKVYTL